MVLDLIAQDLFVVIPRFLDGGQELANLIQGDGDTLPFHPPKAVILGFGCGLTVR